MVESSNSFKLGDYVSVSWFDGNIIGRVRSVGSKCIELESIIMIPSSIISSVTTKHFSKREKL